MRMKEDRNKAVAWPKPAYNVQTGTENQFIVGFSIHQRSGDISCFKSQMQQLKLNLPRLPGRVIGNAGYGSEENYEYLGKEKFKGLLKYAGFDKERSKHRNPFHMENFLYDPGKDQFVCPTGKRLTFKGSRETIRINGFMGTADLYECEDCNQCAFKQNCTRSK